MPNKLSKFWQELKRRNVVRVVTVYAGAAFVILELVDMVREPFELPNWSFKLIIVILSVGLIIAVILSWIYDIHPEGGIIKTEPAHEVKTEDTPKSSISWKIASYISFVVIVGLIVLNIVPRAGREKVLDVLDKSIAVLPFESLSNDPELQYQADGVMDAILLHLCKIEDLRVMSRTSVEQYRDTKKTIPEICEELGVAYVLEGSFQKSGDQIRLIVQLIQSGTEGHLWADNYDREWKDIFTVQSEVAQLVAGELQAVITPEVNERIEKIPTTNLTAYDFFQRGREEQWKYASKLLVPDRIFLDNAEDLYNQALDYDPLFAQAHAGLADVLITKFFHFESLSSVLLDSAISYADKALDYDPQIALAHSVKGRYYLMTGNEQKALQEFALASELNPNDYQIYSNQGFYYFYIDWVKCLKNYHKAALLLSGTKLAEVLSRLSTAYMISGFLEKAAYYSTEALRLGGDSIAYLINMALIEAHKGNYKEAINMYDRILSLNPTDDQAITYKAQAYGFLGQYKESIECYEKLHGRGEFSTTTDMLQIHRLGFAYWQNGDKEIGQTYFNLKIAFNDSIIKMGTDLGRIAYYDLAATYAYLGEKEEALKKLRLFSESSLLPWFNFVIWLKEDDPLFNNIRDDPEFQQIIRDVEDKYQAEHERVRQWLEDNEML